MEETSRSHLEAPVNDSRRQEPETVPVVAATGRREGAGPLAARSWFDRTLLVAVLVLQVLIIGMLLNQRRGADGPPAGSDAEVASRAASLTDPLTLPGGPPRPMTDHASAVAASLRDPRELFDRMDALFEQTVSEIAAMDRLFDRDTGWDALPVSPFLDMRDTGSDYVVIYGVPGMRPADVQVVLNDRILTIHALLECPPYGRHAGRSFQVNRNVRLPGPVGAPSEASAGITNGLLRVALPKADPAATVLTVPVRLF